MTHTDLARSMTAKGANRGEIISALIANGVTRSSARSIFRRSQLSKPRSVAGPQLRLHVPDEVRKALLAAAEVRGVTSARLGGAILKFALEMDGVLDNILDGDEI